MSHFLTLCSVRRGNMVAFLPFLVTRDRRAHDVSFSVLAAAVRCLVHTAQEEGLLRRVHDFLFSVLAAFKCLIHSAQIYIPATLKG